MNELLNKISSYNIFNYLLPGIIFVVLTGDIVDYPIQGQDVVTLAFFYYFVGLVVSRVGSLILEPILRALSFIRFANYKDFVEASKKDTQIEVLSEVNNTYRTFCSLFALLLLTKLYKYVAEKFPLIKEWDWTTLLVLLLVLFLFSYRKQTAYVTKRIKTTG